jgi:putative ABC transport system permease protein
MMNADWMKPAAVRPGWRWMLRMGWRDARASRRPLGLCALALVFGVAALVAVNGLRAQLRDSVESQSRTLLGADLLIQSRRAPTPVVEERLAAVRGELARETRFSSMAFFPEEEATRLVQVRAMEGGFPFYGQWETRPAGVFDLSSDRPEVLVEENLMVQYGLEPGDTIILGEKAFTIAAALLRVPGESAVAGVFAPRVIMAASQLTDTGLLTEGSIAFYHWYYRFEDGWRLEDETLLGPAWLSAEGLRKETVESRRESVAAVLDNLQRYLALVGLVALLLGAIGVAGAVRVYLEGKRDGIAVLRCLGAASGMAMRVYLMQIAVLAAAGAGLGGLIGLLAQQVLPAVVGIFLPVTLEGGIAWRETAAGIGLGWAVAMIFAFGPLIPLRRISPLRVLRANLTPPPVARDPWVWGGYSVVGLGWALVCVHLAGWRLGLIFAASLAAVVLIFALLALVLVAVAARLRRGRMPMAIRYGLASLERPGNRTRYLVVALGMGVFMLNTLFLTQQMLLAGVAGMDGDGTEPNVFFYDVQTDQLSGLEVLCAEAGMPVMETAPVVTMRLEAINGVATASLRNTPGNTVPEWIIDREWRSTWRDEPGTAETVIAGDWVGFWDNWDEPVPVSVEKDIAADMGIRLGDTLTFNIQGIPVECRVASLREVNWQRLRPNFFVVFPRGMLEDAPAFYLAVARAPDREILAAVQREAVRRFPNVAAIDLTLVMETIQQLLDRVAFALRFMAAFTVLTGLVVVVTALLSGRDQRLRESALLRALGGSASLLRRIQLWEMAALGLMAGVAGVLLSLVAGWSLGHWVFESTLVWSIPALLVALLSPVVVALVIGWLCNRRVAAVPPLAVLRQQDA